MSDNNQKENNKVSIKPFIILFVLSIIIFSALYFCHSKNIENRFDKTLQNYEKSMSDIFNNIITNGNNENIYTNSLQTNNNQLQNDSIEKLKLSFEVGFKMLESSMNEIMKNSNDILQFWFAFLSIIMIVFTLIGFFLNNNILDSAKKQLEMVEKEAIISRENIEEETKKLISENNKNMRITSLFNLYTQVYNIKDYNLSINYLSEIIKIYEDDFYNKKYDEKSDNYYKARENCSVAYNNRGISKDKLRKHKEAMEDYNKAIELNPNLSEAYNNRGIVKYNLGNINEAIENYNKAIELNPNYPEAYNNRGIAKAELKLFEEAIEDFNKAIELNPNYSEAYSNRGNAKFDFSKNKEKNSEEYNKLMKEAIKDFDSSIELNINNSEAYYNKGETKSILASSIKEVNKEKYNKLINEAYNDFETAYNLANNELKKEMERQLINLAKQKHEAAIKFCEEHNINYKDNDNKE